MKMTNNKSRKLEDLSDDEIRLLLDFVNGDLYQTTFLNFDFVRSQSKRPGYATRKIRSVLDDIRNRQIYLLRQALELRNEYLTHNGGE